MTTIETKTPSQLVPYRDNPDPTEIVPSDNGVAGGVAGVSWRNGVLSIRASVDEAEAGTDNETVMTPVRTAEAIASQGATLFATAAQGALADTALQSVVPGDYIAVDNTDPKNPEVSVVGIPDGSVTPGKISDIVADRKAIALKILAVSDGDVQLYVSTTGNDTTGDGSIGNPFATPQRAWDSLPAFVTDKYVINIANGTYSTSSRPPSSMQRPALIHCDQKKMGLRSDAPGGVLTASVVFRGESKTGVILQPGSAGGYTTGVYLTAATGIVGFQNFTVDCQPGSVSGMTCHRPGTYMHVLDVDIDGNTTNTTFGMLSESKAMIEAVNVTIHDCPVGVQMISQSVWQSGLASDITNCTTGMTVTDSSWGGLSAASQCSSPVLCQGGGTFDTTGQSGFRTKVNANITVRDGNWEGAFIDVTGTIATYPGARVNLGAMGWSGTWNDYGGSLYIPGGKSFIAPATQSLVATPLIFWGNDRNLFVDATFELRNSSGNLVAESFGIAQATIAADGATIPITLQGKRTVINVYAAAPRIGVLLPQYQSGRLANTPFPDGAQVVMIAFAGTASVQISEGSTSVLNGDSVTLNAGGSGVNNILFTYSGSRGVWIAMRGDSNA